MKKTTIITTGLILLLLLSGCKQEPLEVPKASLLIKLIDYNTNSQIDGNVSAGNGEISRTLGGNWVEFTIPQNQSLNLKGCIQNKDYYETEINSFIGFEKEKQLGIKCLKKSNDIQISSTGKLKNGKFRIDYTLTPNKDHLKLAKLCEEHSTSISYIYFNGLKHKDNCIDFKANLTSADSISFFIDAEAFFPEEKDYIEISIIDITGREFKNIVKI